MAAGAAGAAGCRWPHHACRHDGPTPQRGPRSRRRGAKGPSRLILRTRTVRRTDRRPARTGRGHGPGGRNRGRGRAVGRFRPPPKPARPIRPSARGEIIGAPRLTRRAPRVVALWTDANRGSLYPARRQLVYAGARDRRRVPGENRRARWVAPVAAADGALQGEQLLGF